MNRREYMERLEQLLLVLPEEEREEALQYYHDYFDDAGVEKEETVIRELGAPEEVAAISRKRRRQNMCFCLLETVWERHMLPLQSHTFHIKLGNWEEKSCS